LTAGGGPIEDVRAVVVGRLRIRHDELVREIFARVRGDAFDRAGEDDAEYLAGLRATVAAALEYVLAGIERGEEQEAGPIPAVALEQARRAARTRVSLDTVLRRYVAGSALLGEFIMQEADRGERDGSPPAQREVLRGALRVQAAGLERLLAAITAAYGDELERAGRSPERHRAERVRGLLDGGIEGGTVAGSELGYGLDGWHLGVIVRGAEAEGAVRALAERLDRRLLCVSSGEGTVWAWLGGQRTLRMSELRGALYVRARPPAGRAGKSGRSAGMSGVNRAVSFAVGEPARGLVGWRLTHRQAQAALMVALRRPESQMLTRYADVALLASALKDEMLARALVDIYIAPLRDARDDGSVLCETLRAYLAAECGVSSAAAALGIVRNTVEKRLRTIEERLDKTLHPCPVELEVALALDELTAAKPTDTPRPPSMISADGRRNPIAGA
jgi:hypothetical protein